MSSKVFEEYVNKLGLSSEQEEALGEVLSNLQQDEMLSLFIVDSRFLLMN